MLWAAFWKNNGNPLLSKLPIWHHFMLIQRAVLSVVLWKLSRWPFQKTIAVKLDAIQSQMARKVLPCTRKPTEAIEQFDRRRKANARDFCGKVGVWSSIWAYRCINWIDHVKRNGCHGFLCHRILSHRNSSWLADRRSLFLNARNTFFAGRTGTRGIGGRPQVRYEAGVELARVVLNDRQMTLNGKHSLSVGSKVANAIRHLKGSLDRYAPGSGS